MPNYIIRENICYPPICEETILSITVTSYTDPLEINSSTDIYWTIDNNTEEEVSLTSLLWSYNNIYFDNIASATESGSNYVATINSSSDKGLIYFFVKVVIANKIYKGLIHTINVTNS
jgi:hypothetical protein